MTNIIKECKHHGLTEFKHTTEKPPRYRCKKCSNNAVNKRRRKLKTLAIEYKGGKCEECGYHKSAYALEFHHLDPNEKDFSISVNGHTRSWEKIKVELDKCVMLCSNCHREEHERLNLIL